MDNYKNMTAESSDKMNKEKARKMLGNQGSMSKNCMDKDMTKPYKKGGMVKKSCK